MLRMSISEMINDIISSHSSKLITQLNINSIDFKNCAKFS